MPGFGPLLPIDDVRRLVAEVFGSEPSGGDAAPQRQRAESAGEAEPASERQAEQIADLPPPSAPAAAAELQRPAPEQVDIALQNEAAPHQDNSAPTRRRHGGALAE